MATARVMEAVESFMNPFNLEDDGKLYQIASGAVVPPDIEDDVMNAEAKGKSAKESFINEHLRKNEHFFEPIKRQRLKTFTDMGKTVAVKTTKKHELTVQTAVKCCVTVTDHVTGTVRED